MKNARLGRLLDLNLDSKQSISKFFRQVLSEVVTCSAPFSESRNKRKNPIFKFAILMSNNIKTKINTQKHLYKIYRAFANFIRLSRRFVPIFSMW